MIHTAACEVLGVEHPVVQAGMSRWNTGAALVAAVSAAGGLGVLGCLDRPAGEAVDEIRRIRATTERPFGVNFVLHRRDDETFAACLRERVPVFSFFRGNADGRDLADAVAAVHDAGAVVIHQITTEREAEQALASGVDVLVAQGTEAGGHMGPIPLLALLPTVVDLAGERPVLAAGGIVDGRGLAAALCLGAAGVLMGTRFLATPEAPISASWKNAIVAARAGATVASGIFDLVWGEAWPGVQARALRNGLTAAWVGRDVDLANARERVLAEVQRAEEGDDADGMILLAGEGAALIGAIRPAGEIVHEVVAEAERSIRAASGYIAL